MVDKQMWISKELHTRIKIQSSGRGLTMRDYLDNLVSDDEVRRWKQMKIHKDMNGRVIEEGDIVEWVDAEGVRKAVVETTISFKCIDNRPNKNNWAVGHTFYMGSFMYRDTEKHLKIIEKVKP